MNTSKLKNQKRARRQKRIRAKIAGTAERPRLSVFKSNKYIYVQLIDDEKGSTVVSGTTKEIKAKTPALAAKELGAEIAKKAAAKKIKEVVFDRGGFIYTGKIKAIAEGAREGGLKF
jgi:large subunit ribosomal protein L18